jgi:peroxiredoxin
MSDLRTNRPVQPGEPAPAFELPAITRDGVVRLEDFRGNRPVLLGLFRGLDCPFCRRQIAALSAVDEELRNRGVETLAVVTTPAERARTYVRYRPMRLLVASDEKRAVHRAYGLPRLEITESETAWPHRVTFADIMAMRINPTGELPEPMDPISASKYLDAKDGFEPEPEPASAEEPASSAGPQLVGSFLLDRNGIVRWTFVEAAVGPNAFGNHPETKEIFAAISSLAA